MKRILGIIGVLLLLATPVIAEKATPLISSFNAGELSPKLDARSDLEKYASGARTMENMVPLIEGGATRMPGTYFVLETKDSTQQSRLIPFQFSTVESYVIEAGDEYFRFYKDDGQIGTVDSSTELLLHMDGLEASTTFTDSGTTGHTVSVYDQAQIDTSQYKFVSGSAYLSGSTDSLGVSDSDGVDDYWHLDTDAFTIEGWFRHDLLASTTYGYWQQQTNNNNYIDFAYDSTNDKFIFRLTVGGAPLISEEASYTLAVDTWYHIAVIRGWGGYPNSWAITVNGTAIHTFTDSSALADFSGSFIIGRDNTASPYYFVGWIDEFRISKGVARWTANFTPPTQEYPYVDDGELTGGGGTVYQVTTPYQAEDVFGLKTVQSADYLYIFHPDYPPKTLTRTSDVSWTLADYQTKVGTEMDITAITKADPAVVTCTTVPTTLASGDIVYIADVGGMTEVNSLYFTVASVTTGAAGHFQLSGIDSSGYTAYTSGGTAQETLYGTDDNQPSCGTFFEQRLVLSGSNNNPQTINMSVSSDYNDFTLGTDDDDAIQYTIVSNKVDRVRWMMGLDYLMVGTVGGVWRVGATTTADPITPSNVLALQQVSGGVKNIEPQLLGDSLLYVSRSGTRVHQLVFDLLKDKFTAPDMTRLAKHIAVGDSSSETGITQLDYMREPLPILWGIRADGQLLGMTYETQENIYAWFRVVTDGSFESVAVISEEDQEDRIWAIVNRTIDGSTVRYVEYFKPFEFYGEIEDAFFVHSGLTWDGTATSTLSNLDHLEGETVAVLGDGLVQASKTVSSGSITLATAASKIQVGLPYTSILEPMKLNAGHTLGTARGKTQKINKINVSFYQTGDGVEFGPSQSNLKDFTGFTAGSLSTDDLSEIFHGNFSDEAAITIQQADPLPMTVLAIVPWVTLNEE